MWVVNALRLVECQEQPAILQMMVALVDEEDEA
jgi:hypothetical protein